MRGRSSNPFAVLASSPTMVGAIATLITVIAVFLAYNANNGLPFVPSYRVSVDIPNAARSLKNNEVRIGGRRVGVIEGIEPIASGDGPVAARMTLKLDESIAPLPQDSTFRVRYRSAFGLKYLEVTRGSGPGVEEGGRFDGTDDPVTGAEPGTPEADNGRFVVQTEFDDIYNTFDAPTRRGVRAGLTGFGDAFAARGASINRAIAAAAPLLRDLRPVAKLLADRDTRLRRFVTELGDYGAIVAPVAAEQARLFTAMATTFEAISSDPQAIRETISEGPETLAAGIRVLPGQTRFIGKTADLFETLAPASELLPATLRTFDTAISEGAPVLARTPSTSRRLGDALAALEALIDDPTTKVTLKRLRGLLADAKPTIRFAAPMQTVCNYWVYFWTLVPNAVSDEDQVGFSLRNSIIQPPPGPIEVGLPGPPPFDRVTLPGEVETPLGAYSGIMGNGRAGQLAASPGEFDPYHLPILYGNPYGPVGQHRADCQFGQFGYSVGSLPVAGQAENNPAIGVSDLPGTRGPTTLFLEQDGTRVLKDTRIPERQP